MRKKVFVLALLAIAVTLLSFCAAYAARNTPKSRASKFKPLKGTAADQMIKAIEDSLEKMANGTGSVHGKGTVENEFIGKKNIKEFEFWMKKPGKMRLVFTAPDDIKGTLMVTDGTFFWNFVPSLKKTYKVSLKQEEKNGKEKPLQKELGLLSAIVSTPLERKEFWKKFELSPLGTEVVDGHECNVVEFKVRGAKKNQTGTGGFEQYLWIEKKTGITWMIELLVFGAPELVRIQTLEFNSKIDNEIFLWKK